MEEVLNPEGLEIFNEKEVIYNATLLKQRISEI